MSTTTIAAAPLRLTCPSWCNNNHDPGPGQLDHSSETEAIKDEAGRLVGDVFIWQEGNMRADRSIIWGPAGIGAEVPDYRMFTAEHARAIAALLVAAADRLERG